MHFYGHYGNYQCDNNLTFGWYRFRGAAGTQMATSCLGMNQCGAEYPGWFSGSHPSVADGAVRATVCFDYYYLCCLWLTSIRVRNCSGFYVYELGPTSYCSSRYCGNGGGENTKEDKIDKRIGSLVKTINNTENLIVEA